MILRRWITHELSSDMHAMPVRINRFSRTSFLDDLLFLGCVSIARSGVMKVYGKYYIGKKHDRGQRKLYAWHETRRSLEYVHFWIIEFE